MGSRRPSHSQPEAEPLDLAAIGAGPANLSLAALAAPLAELKVIVLERKRSFSWHPGNLFLGAGVTTAPLKDLVTLVDPTNPLSFLNFLAEDGRLYRSLIAGRDGATRREFSEYFAWAAARCPSVRFGVEVAGVDHDGRHFILESEEGTWRARNLVLGIGLSPSLPACTRPLLGSRVFHASRFLDEPREIAGRRVLVVGGGQSAAEVALHVLRDDASLPSRLTWVSNRHGFLPLDDSPFSNEWFNPRYTEYFHHLPARRRAELLQRQLLASDGANQSTLQAVYGRLYELDYFEGPTIEHDLLGGHELVALREGLHGDYEAVLECHDTGMRDVVRADTVILATGYRSQLPQLLEPLAHRIATGNEGPYRVGPDYELEWDGPEGQRIFVQGAARNSHGIADPNLSLASWRSAVILNKVCGRRAYPVERGDITLSLDLGLAPLVQPKAKEER